MVQNLRKSLAKTVCKSTINFLFPEKSGTVTDVNSIDIPPSAFKDTSGINTAIVFGLYSTSRLFPLRINETYSENTTVGSTVIAAKIAGKMVNDLVEPVIIKLTLITQVSFTIEFYVLQDIILSNSSV